MTFSYFKVGTFFLLFTIIHAQISLNYLPERKCTDRNIFDGSSLSCVQCPFGWVPDEKGTSCICQAGFRRAESINPTNVTCVPCDPDIVYLDSAGKPIDGTANGTSPTPVDWRSPNNITSSTNKLVCMNCDAITGATYNAATRDCNCPIGYFILEKVDPAELSNSFTPGAYLTAKTCIRCPITYFISPNDPYSCIPCPNPNMNQTADGKSCQCNDGYVLMDNTTCAPALVANSIITAFSNANQITYQDIIATEDDRKSKTVTSTTISSQTIQQYYAASSFRCQEYADPIACNALGNLCVLQQYEQSAAACQMYLRIAQKYLQTFVNGENDWPNHMPWLYYNDKSSVVLKETNIQRVVSFDKGSTNANYMSFILAQFNINGTFLGFKELSNELQLCSQSLENTRFLTFGYHFENECVFNLSSIILDSPSTIFYDMYLLDNDNKLQPVAVLNLNQRENGQLVNTKVDDYSLTEGTLTRRFFVYDTISGYAQATDLLPQVVRYAKSIKLRIEMQKGSSEKIVPPLLEIEYGERYTSAILADPGKIGKESVGYPKASFSTFYERDAEAFTKATLALAVIGGVFAFIQAIVRHWGWMRRNSRNANLIDLTFFAKFFVHLLDSASDWLFWVMFILAASWFVFFKGQARVHLLTPLDKQERAIWALLLVAFFGKFMRIVDIIYSQTRAHITFLDWEQSHGRTVSKSGEEVVPVSVWRTLFVANEWNELQTRRIISLELTLFVILVLLRAAKLEFLATPQPATSNLSEGDTEWILRLAVILFFWLVIGLVQIIFQYAIRFRFFTNDITQFVDLLSVSNISMVIFYEQCYGWYVHGRTVHTHSDTDLVGLLTNLKREEDNIAGSRGLLPNSPVQVFEMITTQALRNEYDKVFLFIMLQDFQERTANTPITKRQIKKIPNEKTLKAHQALDFFFKGLIGNTHNFKHQIMEKSRIHKMLKLPPDLSLSSNTYFFPNENSRSFARCVFFGVEYDLFMFNILVYCVMDLLTQNTFADIIVTWVVNQFLIFLRSHYGSSNITKKTLVDERFLL